MLALLMLASLLALAGISSARADFEFEDADVRLQHSDGSFSRQAGEHADFRFLFSLPTDPVTGFTLEGPHSVTLDLPPGLVANPTAIATCDMVGFAAPANGGAYCPVEAQVGVALVHTIGANGGFLKVGVYNLPHGPDVPARLGFNVLNALAIIEPQVRPGDYGVSAGSPAIAQALNVISAQVTLWGVPADPQHDFERLPYIPNAGLIQEPFDPPFALEVPFPDGAAKVGFMSSPTACTETPVSFTARGDSWEHPGIFDTRTLSADPDGLPFRFSGCNKLPFAPTATVTPQSRAAQAPSGLDVDIDLPQSDAPDALATAHVRKVEMTFPDGVSVNASSAQGRGACSPSQIGIGSNDAPSCPEASKLGTVTIDTPLLDEQLKGSVYLATQGDNPFNSLLALYIAVKGPGFWLKLPGKASLDPNTGQLTTVFDNTPQQPFTNLHLQLAGGPRAALSVPAKCGTYNIHTEFTSWASNTPVVSDSPFTVDQGCAAAGQFAPGLKAIASNLQGGAFSPFTLQITRSDGEPNLSKIQATLPEGLLAKLKGVELCGDVQAAIGACPASSQVGKVTVGAGSGPNPLYVPEAGKAPTAAYLSGPYKGAPYSLVVKVPAQAGPFDLGTVAVRNGLYVDPTTAQVTAVSDTLPQILQGIPIAYRDVRVEVDRPDFIQTPTDCGAKKVESTIHGAGGASASPAANYQAANCERLGFRPKLALKFSGATHRSAHPALKATLTMLKGGANIAKTVVLLPETEFIDNAHISNPCTRVRFNEGACPASSILGTAKAYTPLLDKPLSGPVYFRSNGGARELPDLVADLDGQIHVTLVGFIDSIKTGPETARVRTRFVNVPDAPVSKFVLSMKGGDKGLIVNNTELCRARPRAKAQLTGQNGRSSVSNPRVKLGCRGAGKR
jgi:hypothetical protein